MSEQEFSRREEPPRRHRGGPPHGGPMGPMMGMEKAKNFKASMKKLLRYIAEYRIGIVVVSLFAAASTVFGIFGPKLTSKIITKIGEGIGAANGIDFTAIARLVLFTLGLYVISAGFSFVEGYVMTGISQKVAYRLRKELSEKINRLPMNFFDKHTNGEILSRVTNDVDMLSQSLNQRHYHCGNKHYNAHRRADYDAVHQRLDDADFLADAADFRHVDFVGGKKIARVFPPTAGISRSCERTGRGGFRRSYGRQGI